jgi:NAD(P)-dependent dehydrogenase (short-subunit alcohol dehydrogenase family)
VTGGGSGVGRELARQLAAPGCSVAACDYARLFGAPES